MPTATRSKERTNCLADILIGAVEDGGLNGWRQVSRYRYELVDPDDICSGTTDASVRVHDLEEEKVHDVTLDTIATGLRRLAEGEVKACQEIVGAVVYAQRHNDASCFDAYSADAVLQAGLFGELIYG